MTENKKNMFIVYFIGIILGMCSPLVGFACGFILMLLVWFDN